MTKKKVQPRRGRGKDDGTAVGLTAERIKAILSDPKTPQRVKRQFEELTYKLYAETNAFSEATPDSCAADFINGTAALIATPDEDARAVHDEIVRLAEANEPEGYRVARRCVEIYNEWRARKGGRKYADGAYYFAQHVDAVLEGGEGLMPDLNSRYFTPLFAEAARERGRRDRHYRRLLGLIQQVDEGADLNQLHHEAKQKEAARREQDRAEELAKPEPKDKTSDEWRYWTLRHFEAATVGDDEAARVEAWGGFWSFFDDFKNRLLSRTGYTAEDASAARELLPGLIINWQRAQPRKGKGKGASK